MFWNQFPRGFTVKKMVANPWLRPCQVTAGRRLYETGTFQPDCMCRPSLLPCAHGACGRLVPKETAPQRSAGKAGLANEMKVLIL